jgi:hypothetical protein
MKEDRELLQLSKTHTLEEIADKLRRLPATVVKAASRLGLTIKREAKL